MANYNKAYTGLEREGLLYYSFREADFSPVYKETSKNEGGWQKYPNDSANWCDGKLIGTNLGISAIGFKGFYGHCPTEEQLRALTPDQAKAIYKKNYWGKIRGDEIKDQSVARVIFGMYIGSPVLTISIVSKVLREEFNKDVKVSSRFSDELIKTLNKLPPKRLFEALKEEKMNRIRQSSNTMFIKGWLGKYERMTYESTNKPLLFIGITVAILALTYFILVKKKIIKL